MSSTIAIIGGNGFIGKNFSQYFSEKGYKVMVIDHNVAMISNTDPNLLPYYHQNLTYPKNLK